MRANVESKVGLVLENYLEPNPVLWLLTPGIHVYINNCIYMNLYTSTYMWTYVIYIWIVSSIISEMHFDSSTLPCIFGYICVFLWTQCFVSFVIALWLQRVEGMEWKSSKLPLARCSTFLLAQGHRWGYRYWWSSVVSLVNSWLNTCWSLTKIISLKLVLRYKIMQVAPL